LKTGLVDAHAAATRALPGVLLLVVVVGHRMLLYDERTTTRSIDDDYSKATLIIKV